MYAGIERRQRPAQGIDGGGGDSVDPVEQPRHPRGHQGTDGAHEMGAVDERQPLLAVQREGFGAELGEDVGAADEGPVGRVGLTLSEQRQKRMRAGRQVPAGPQRAGPRHPRREAAVEQGHHPLEHHRAHRGVAEQQAVEAHRHRGPHRLAGQVLARAGGVAAQQVDLQVALQLGSDRVGHERSEAGADPVHGGAGGEDPLERGAVGPDVLDGLRIQLDPGAGADGGHLLDRQRAVEDHWLVWHGSADQAIHPGSARRRSVTGVRAIDAESLAQGSFLSCLHYVLALAPSSFPALSPGEDPADGWTVSRWLGGLGLGIARARRSGSLRLAGQLDRARAGSGRRSALCRHVRGALRGGVGSRPADGVIQPEWITEGYLIAATDIAQARPPLPEAPTGTGLVEAIWVAPSAGEPTRSLTSARALPGQGLEGDRHVTGTGTFPSGRPGSALTLVAAEVCEAFEPPLTPDEHRRNVVVRGLDIAQLVGHEFSVGSVRCRGMRLCEPCPVVQRYAGRPVLRALVHRGGLRADILTDGEIHVGDPVHAVGAPGLC